MLILTALIFAIILASIIEPYTLQVKKETLEYPDLPEAFDGLKIGFISDLHVDSQGKMALMAKRIALLNQQGYDLLILGGDYSDTLAWQERVFALLSSEIQAKYGAYAVRGNHDIYAGQGLFDVIKKSGITLLHNDAAKISKDGQSIYLIGVDDFHSEFFDLDKALRHAKKDEFNILVAHKPKTAKLLEQKQQDNWIKFTLCGHTHGGQITFFGLYSPLADRKMPAFASQWIKHGSNPTLYSNGMGEWLPLRFFAKPQMHMITLKKQR